MSYFAAPPPRLFGHRGAAGVAPENTMPSFAIAAALGADYLELDVRATSDGTIVVLHDPAVDRTTDGEGPVSALTWQQVEALDAGYRFTWNGERFPYRRQGVRIPFLESVLRGFPGHCFNIEIKQEEPSIVPAVVDLLKRTHTADRTLLAAERDAIMQAIRAEAAGRIATGISAGEVAEFIDRVNRDEWEGYTPPGRALQVPPAFAGVELVNPASLAAAHRLAVEVHVWTINDSAEIERLLDLGVDGVMSDFPGLVATAARRRGRSTVSLSGR